LPATPRATLKGQIAELRRVGIALLKKAEKKPTIYTKSNGEQISPTLRAALECLEAADRCEGRFVRRMDGDRASAGTQREPKDELDAFRKKKTAR
jgi:hypothetical protein